MQQQQEESSSNLSYGRVDLPPVYMPTDEDKHRYQRADVVNAILVFETGVLNTLEQVVESIGIARNAELGSAQLDRLQALTVAYQGELTQLLQEVEEVRLELVGRAMQAHGLVLDTPCGFDVSGYQFTAVPSSKNMNIIISDVFSYSDIANVNMTLSDVIITGSKKPRKGNVPCGVMINLWDNNHEYEED
ncbi:hypothetical protein [Serratia liquefaciens]|uniref:hypothetical protein n=1 Tax=Serratia liquefaciens TaxID=614 RepID=UPI003906AFFC